MQSKYEI